MLSMLSTRARKHNSTQSKRVLEHFSMWASKQGIIPAVRAYKHASTWATRKHTSTSSTQVRKHAKNAGMQACQADSLEDSFIWSFTTCKVIKKEEKIQERSLNFILSDYDKTYFQLLEISKKQYTEVKRLRIPLAEIFKTLIELNSLSMKDIFDFRH